MSMNKSYTLSSIWDPCCRCYVKIVVKRLFYPSRTYLKRSVIDELRASVWKIIRPRSHTSSWRNKRQTPRCVLPFKYLRFMIETFVKDDPPSVREDKGRNVIGVPGWFNVRKIPTYSYFYLFPDHFCNR